MKWGVRRAQKRAAREEKRRVERDKYLLENEDLAKEAVYKATRELQAKKAKETASKYEFLASTLIGAGMLAVGTYRVVKKMSADHKTNYYM